MKHTILKITLAALTAAALSACDSGGGDNSEPIVNQPELPFGVDKNFGSAGYVKPDFSATHDSLNNTRSYDIASVTTDAAGRVTAVGRFKNSDRGSDRAFIARFLPSGAPDTTCGTNGVTELFELGLGEALDKIQAAPGGGYYAMVSSERRAMRITEGCMIDRAYGTDGFAWANYRAQYLDMAVGADDSIVLLARDHVVRVQPNGVTDATFGGGAAAALRYPASASTLMESVRIRQDGRIVIGGRIQYGGSAAVSNYFAFVAQLDASGQLDTGFGNGGFATSEPGFVVELDRGGQSLDLTNDGGAILAWGGRKVLADGTAPSDVSVMFKVDSRGVAAQSFGRNGLVEWTHKGYHALNYRVSVDANEAFACGALNESAAPSLGAAYVLGVNVTTGNVDWAVMFKDAQQNPAMGQTYKFCHSIAAANGRTYAAISGIDIHNDAVITRVLR